MITDGHKNSVEGQGFGGFISFKQFYAAHFFRPENLLDRATKKNLNFWITQQAFLQDFTGS